MNIMNIEINHNENVNFTKTTKKIILYLLSALALSMLVIALIYFSFSNISYLLVLLITTGKLISSYKGE